MTSLETEIASLAKLPIDQLRKRWQRTFNFPVPKGLSRDLMVRGLSHRMQERIHGSLSQAARRKLRTFTKQLQAGDEGAFDPGPVLKPGTKLIREWQGRAIEVLVLDDGFEFEGCCYGSLSIIARELTGVRWSGPRFFGLRKAASSDA